MESTVSRQAADSLVVVSQQAWDRLVDKNYVDTSLLRKEIALSWERCLERGVSTSQAISRIKDIDLLIKREESERLYSVAISHMKQLYESLKGKGCVLILTDPKGVILDIFGDKRMNSLAESLDVVPGADNSEQVIGTTAPGISLMRRIPVRVHAQEHYCQLYHNWSCSAAPIFDSQGNLLGSLDVSNADPYNHPPLMLELVKMTVKAIEMEFNFRELHKQYNRSVFFLGSVVEELSEPIVFFDDKDNIRHLNREAQALIGVSGKDVLGVKGDTVLVNFNKAKQDIKKGLQWTELQFVTPSGPVGVEAHLRQILGKNKTPMGILGSLKKKEVVNTNEKTTRYTFDDFVFRNSNVAAVIRQASVIATTDFTVLIEGESGTGKEILAQAIHHSSPRKNKPFVAINSAALPSELIQSELFGYEQGAFTGANRNGKAGKFELASGGTLFLDEIGDMPLEAQANLLRVLQEQSISRIGGSRPIPIDVRVIAATNKDLKEQAKAGLFREDLYYRLAVINLSIPPLRQRPEDLDVLLDFLVERCPKSHLPFTKIRFSEETMKILKNYSWPGNVRELENIIISVISTLEDGVVYPHHLPPRMISDSGLPEVSGKTTDLREAERKLITAVLYENEGNILQAAKALNISRATLYRKIRKFEIQVF